MRLWAEIKPAFVKIDKHFITDIHLDPHKIQPRSGFGNGERNSLQHPAVAASQRAGYAARHYELVVESRRQVGETQNGVIRQ